MSGYSVVIRNQETDVLTYRMYYNMPNYLGGPLYELYKRTLNNYLLREALIDEYFKEYPPDDMYHKIWMCSEFSSYERLEGWDVIYFRKVSMSGQLVYFLAHTNSTGVARTDYCFNDLDLDDPQALKDLIIDNATDYMLSPEQWINSNEHSHFKCLPLKRSKDEQSVFR